MRTVLQALIDEIHYPIREGFALNVLTRRGLDDGQVYDYEIANSDAFKGCVADCLCSLVEAPNFSEADTSISLSEKALILRKANAIYRAIGEETVLVDEPMVYIGE